jgi:hypothetical protein
MYTGIMIPLVWSKLESPWGVAEIRHSLYHLHTSTPPPLHIYSDLETPCMLMLMLILLCPPIAQTHASRLPPISPRVTQHENLRAGDRFPGRPNVGPRSPCQLTTRGSESSLPLGEELTFGLHVDLSGSHFSHINFQPGSRSPDLPVRHLGRLGGHGRHQRCLADACCGLQRRKRSSGGPL